MANEPVTGMAYGARMAHMAAMESAAMTAAAVTPSRGERDARCGNRKNQKQPNRQRQQPLQVPHLLSLGIHS